jgi:hypothetical protein
MVTGADVLEMLIPTGGWAIIGNDFDGIEFLEAKPITKYAFDAGFAQFEAWKSEQESAKIAAKEIAKAKLEALGLTLDDLKALGL